MKVIYIANNDLEFTNKVDCEDYNVNPKLQFKE